MAKAAAVSAEVALVKEVAAAEVAVDTGAMGPPFKICKKRG